MVVSCFGFGAIWCRFESCGDLPRDLSPKAPAQKGKIQAEILVLHGEIDTMVSLDDVASFRQEMHDAEVDHEVIIFEDAKHGFSNPLADERAKANNVDLAITPKLNIKD